MLSTTAEYGERCAILREAFANPALTTDVIVGFPGETEEEFEETRQFLERIHFYEMHVFKYSRRAGTRAARMEGQIPEEEKTARSEILLKLDQELWAAYRAQFLNREEELLLEEAEEIGGKRYMTGYTGQYVRGAAPFEEGLNNQTVTGVFTGFLSRDILLLNR